MHSVSLHSFLPCRSQPGSAIAQYEMDHLLVLAPHGNHKSSHAVHVHIIHVYFLQAKRLDLLGRCTVLH